MAEPFQPEANVAHDLLLEDCDQDKALLQQLQHGLGSLIR